MDNEDIKESLNALIRKRDELVSELEDLQDKHKSGLVAEEEYQSKRRAIEREIVEVMDRIVQLQFISGQR
ncbi:MAG: hypothetical protein ACP5T2_05845 [Thermoprotei archaeon]